MNKFNNLQDRIESGKAPRPNIFLVITAIILYPVMCVAEVLDIILDIFKCKK